MNIKSNVSSNLDVLAGRNLMLKKLVADNSYLYLYEYLQEEISKFILFSIDAAADEKVIENNIQSMSLLVRIRKISKLDVYRLTACPDYLNRIKWMYEQLE